VIEGIAESTTLVLKVFSGAFTDYLGRRKTLVVTGYALSALTKPIFPMATSVTVILGGRFLDRIGKGIRDAPRDALIVDITPSGIRGAAFGLRQAIDNVGAFIGPLTAVLLMLLWSNNFQWVFWVACVPAVLAVLLLLTVKEPVKASDVDEVHPLRWSHVKQLSPRFIFVVMMGAVLGLARFSEAFLVLRAFDSDIPIALVPLVMVVMNLVYAISAYPLGLLSDRFSHSVLLAGGLLILLAADLCFAAGTHWGYVLGGVSLWGLHMGMTQGLLASMVAKVAPEDLRGTAFGFYNLALGLAMLLSSTTAGWLWSQWGAKTAFYASGGFCLLGVLMLTLEQTSWFTKKHA
jgi:MFS family permease